jgi:predicted dehydrogenase
MTTTRRHFLKTASLAAVATQLDWVHAADTTSSQFKNLIAPGKKMRIAGIGVGGKGESDINACADVGEQIVALCDVDFDRARKTFEKFPMAARYRDFRQMLQEMKDEIDGVVISTPDHMHFPAAMMAIEMGKHAYIQKPLTHTIAEARELSAATAKAQVVTQMGNHGHANEGTRLIKEWIEAGVIGNVHTVHMWTNRPIWPQGIDLPSEVQPVPDTLDWNLWQGVAPTRGYNKAFVPFAWRAWWDYGCGALGDMGCHLMDAPFWALNLRGDFRVSAETSGENQVCAPKWSIVRYEFPQRGDLIPCSVSWFDGGVKPPVPGEYGDGPLPGGGTFYYGDKGILFSPGDYSESPQLLPKERMDTFKNRPKKTYRRIKGANPHREWIEACKGGPIPGSNVVEHAAPLTEFVLAGNLAIRAGKPLIWDSTRGVCVGAPEFDRLINKNYRVF